MYDEKKPLIGDKNGGGGSSAALEHGAMGNSPAMSTTLNDDSSQQSSIGYSIDGYLIGNGGLLVSLALLLGCYFILILTVLSICAISTNGAIEGGGAYLWPYYCSFSAFLNTNSVMISRTLGPEMGGAIGLVFYIANVFSCALYTSGCVEGILQGISEFGFLAPVFINFTSATSGPVNATIVPHGNETIPLEFNGYQIYGIAIGINLTLLCICIIGANFFGKCTNFFFLAVSCIAILTLIALLAQNPITVSFLHSSELNLSKVAGNFTGPSIATLKSNLYEHYTIDYNNGKQINAMTLFSVLFSGVTGITNGANMSGELRNPGYSIPRGTLLALSFTFCMYCLLFVATACSTATDVLQYNYVFMGYVSFWMPLVYVGIALATLCASLSNMIGASRILRAVADDRVFGESSSPPLIIKTFYYTLITLPLGNLFNFLSWGCTRNNNNSSSSGGCSRCLTHNEFLGPLLLTFDVLGNIDRPQFKHFSLISCGLGLLSTVVVMLLLSVLAAFICIVVFGILLFCLYLYHLKHPSAEIQWGSVAQAVLFHTVRKYLLKLDFRREHVKFWRPHLLLLVANPRTACPLIDFLNDLKKSGIYILGHVMEAITYGDIYASLLFCKVSEKSPCDLSEEYNRWQELVDHLKVKAFVSVTESSSLRAGALQMVRVTGLGALKPNTVVLGFRDAAHPNDFLTMFVIFCLVFRSRYMLRPSKSIPSNWHPIRDRKGADDDASPARDRLPERLSLHDYVGLLNDILRAGKNLALCRHFDALNKEHIIRRRNQPVRYIDVWPINFMCPETSTLDDTASLFTLQLGTILNMVKFWSKNTKYRVFLIEPFEWPRDFLTEQQAKIKETLASVRMNAEIVSVPWKAPPKTNNQGIHDASNFSSALTSSSSSSSGGRGGDVTGEQLTRLTAPYLDDVNSALRTHGTAAAVTLLNVSPPPLDVSKYQAYIDALTIITDGIGPCVMVHGVSKVTTTML
ncbi:hypothetical protein HAZT_HAZT002987 [Hyalella azteca]|uniref:Solute carrier family 12 member 9 n=1 Tax=Hyalella azteca TaxID=294128 RepID=A0A6A0GNF9_HYAAZ|nr:hypothetical protein HAZT_HAZT002987 [Hyalella azteca]